MNWPTQPARLCTDTWDMTVASVTFGSPTATMSRRPPLRSVVAADSSDDRAERGMLAQAVTGELSRATFSVALPANRR